jgi:hypothetical protein
MVNPAFYFAKEPEILLQTLAALQLTGLYDGNLE